VTGVLVLGQTIGRRLERLDVGDVRGLGPLPAVEFPEQDGARGRRGGRRARPRSAAAGVRALRQPHRPDGAEADRLDVLEAALSVS